MENKKTKAIGYIRVSTRMQVEQGVSLDEQESRLRGYANYHDIELVRVERDEGFSGKNSNRPGFKAVMAALDMGEVEAVLVTRLDRFTRSVRELLGLVEVYFLDGKRQLISMTENIDTRSAHGRFSLALFGSLAQLERERMGERVSAVLAYKKQNMEYIGGRVPYGYDNNGGLLIENEKEQRIIKKMVGWRRQGLNYPQIAKRLLDEGYRRRTGTPFDKKAVWRVIRHEIEFEDAKANKKRGQNESQE